MASLCENMVLDLIAALNSLEVKYYSTWTDNYHLREKNKWERDRGGKCGKGFKQRDSIRNAEQYTAKQFNALSFQVWLDYIGFDYRWFTDVFFLFYFLLFLNLSLRYQVAKQVFIQQKKSLQQMISGSRTHLIKKWSCPLLWKKKKTLSISVVYTYSPLYANFLYAWDTQMIYYIWPTYCIPQCMHSPRPFISMWQLNQK